MYMLGKYTHDLLTDVYIVMVFFTTQRWTFIYSLNVYYLFAPMSVRW